MYSMLSLHDGGTDEEVREISSVTHVIGESKSDAVPCRSEETSKFCDPLVADRHHFA